MTARKYLDECRALGIRVFNLLERKERMFASAIYSSPKYGSNSSAHANASKVQNITDEMLRLDEIIKMFQNVRYEAFKKMMFIEDIEVRRITIKFYYDCCSYSQITNDTGVSRSTVKRKLKEGIAEIEKILKTS